MIRLALLLCLLALPARAAQFNFCWLGSGGYTLTGTIAFPDSLMAKPLLTEDDVTAFRITGYLHGVPIGQWDAAARRPGATWHLRFRPRDLSFPTGGSFPGDAAQGWNAAGDVEDCGSDGFGFNSGNYAQDVCLYGTWVAQSSIPPATPFVATSGPVTPACQGPDLLGRLEGPEAARG